MVTLTGVTYEVNFQRNGTDFCTASVTSNVGEYGVGSARAEVADPLVVDVILFYDQKSGTLGNFYVTAVCF